MYTITIDGISFTFFGRWSHVVKELHEQDKSEVLIKTIRDQTKGVTK